MINKSINGLFITLLLGSTSAYAVNKLEYYKKQDGDYVTFSDGSGKISIGCVESSCKGITGRYAHPHNIQLHKKTFLQLDEDGKGSYSLWDYNGNELLCSGKISKWGLLYKKDALVSPNILFVASKDISNNSECEFSTEIKVYTDFKHDSTSSSFKYFSKSN